MDLQQATISSIEPVFDFKEVSGGYFKVSFNKNFDEHFELSFVPFLDYFIRRDTQLFDYLKKNHKNQTVSHAINDLYDLGVPVDKWVEEYFEMVKTQTDANLFNALVQFYLYIKNFNSSGSADLDDFMDS